MASANETSILFTPIRIGNLTIPNRFVRSATHDFMAESKDGSVAGRQVDLYRELARGEVGLIITGHAFIHPAGKASPGQMGIHEDRLVDGLSRIAAAVHEFPSRIFVQVAHAGRQTKEKLCGCTPLAPSAVYDPTFKLTPRAMTGDEILRTIDDFIQAARRAREAGFDGVQVHAAHGYLLSSFLSPHTNRREDEWGGSTFGRSRITVEIIRRIKALLGDSFPVIIKLNSTDFLPTGLQVEESMEIARILVEAGLDGIEVSGGISEAGRGSMWKGERSEEDEGYFVENAAKIKSAVPVPVFGLGGIRSFRVMENFVESGRVDLISLSRPLIREPGLIHKFRTGRIGKSACISCNRCFNPRGIKCAEIK